MKSSPEEGDAGGRSDSLDAGGRSDSLDAGARLDDLEIKLAFAEDLLEQLNRQVATQQEQIEFLVREVVRLREQGAGGAAGNFTSLRDELPPHY